MLTMPRHTVGLVVEKADEEFNGCSHITCKDPFT